MDQRLPELVAVITPARTDIVGVRQSGDTRDKRETIAQVLSLIADSDIAESNVTQHEAALTITESQISNLQAYLLPVDLTSIAAGSAAAPSLAWGDGDTGFYELTDGIINFTSQGVGVWSFRTGAILPFNAAGPAMLNEAATSINPTFAPNASNLDTGLGWNAIDQLSLVAGGVEIARVTQAVGANQFAIVSSGAPTTVPELTSLVDPDTGFAWAGSNQIDILTAGSISWSLSSAQIASSFSDGAAMRNTTGDITVAGFVPQKGDIDTGLGADGFDTVSLVAGGIAGLRLKELNSGVIQAPVADVAITAFATGGQASAVALKQSYNVLAVVATTGDSIKLPATFNVNSIVDVKNDGANSADIFPATGDDLGAGLNTAVAVAAGESVTFIATVANATWTQRLVFGGGGVPDPLLLGDGTAGAPTYSFTSSPTTGIYRSAADRLAFAVAGVGKFQFRGNNFESLIGNSPIILNEAATGTNPTLIPHGGDSSTGIGANAAAGELSIISSGVEVARFVNTAGVDQVIIHPGFIPNDPLTPSLAFGDGDSGFYENSDDFISVAIAGVRRFVFGGNNTGFGGVVTGSGRIMDEVASATNPTIVPFNTDLDTGLGHNAEDQLDLIAGGLSCMSVRETAAARQIGFYTTAPVSLQTGVAVTAAGVHAAMVNLGLITA